MTHPPLTERQREVIAAVVQTGHIKGAAVQLGITESGAHRRVAYAVARCGCPSLLSLVFRHHHELDGATRPPTARAVTAWSMDA